MEPKLFEFSHDANKEKLKIRKSNIILQWVRCNGFYFSRSIMFTNKAAICLDDGLFQKNFGPSSRAPKLMKMQY